MRDETRVNRRLRSIRCAERSKRIILTLTISFQLAICAIPFALAQRNANSQSLAKLVSASRGMVPVGNALPATIIVVTNTKDNGPGSLRDALAVANDGDTIDATGVSGIIFLTSGELQINHNVTINGPGSANLALNGSAASRVFENFAANVTISGFTITNGLPADTNGGGGILNHGGLTVSDSGIVSNSAGGQPPFFSAGGGINSTGGGTLTVTNSVVSNNGSGYGGGIRFNGGTLTVTTSVISGNGGDGGGGISAAGTVTVSNSTINSNEGGCAGGGIAGNGTLTVLNSTISSNTASGGKCVQQAPVGGGIAWSDGTLTVMNSTISGNTSNNAGGGIYNSFNGLVTVTNSTISGNSGFESGGGFLNDGTDGNAAVTISNSTFSGNSAPTGGSILNVNGGTAQIGNTLLNAGASGGTIFNSGGTVTSLGYNLASDNGGGVLTGPGDQINSDPMLGPLQDNAGLTFTHALLPGSPAINAGNPSFTPPPLYDQRGSPFHRIVNDRIDIGSFEVQVSRASPTPRPRLTPPPRP